MVESGRCLHAICTSMHYKAGSFVGVETSNGSTPKSRFFATNTTGVAVFLFVASDFWIEPDLADVPGANVGSAFGWVFFAAPIPLFFVVFDLVWIAAKSVRNSWGDRIRYAGIFLVALATWAGAVLFDGAHHGI